MQRHTTCFVISKCGHSRQKRVQLRWKSCLSLCCCFGIFSAFFAHFTIHSWLQLKPVFRISATFAKSSINQVTLCICCINLCVSVCVASVPIAPLWADGSNQAALDEFPQQLVCFPMGVTPLRTALSFGALIWLPHPHTHTHTVPQAKCRHRRCQSFPRPSFSTWPFTFALLLGSIPFLCSSAWSELTELSCC